MRTRAMAAVALAALAAGCGAAPGSDNSQKKSNGTPAKTATSKPDIAKAGKVTLTVWDQEVRGGQNAEITRLNKAFAAKYPNVTIKRVARSFTDLKTTLKLALSGSKAPDVVEANQGRPDMGEMVKAGLLRPLNDYAKVYGWRDRYSSTLLSLNSFSSDGKDFGAGNLYGLSQMGEIVGLYYNKAKVRNPPTTFAAFQQQLQAAKQAGDVGIEFGNLEKSPGIHEYETVLAQTAPKQAVRNFVFSKPGASFDQPGFTQAATTISDWVKKGYFNKGFNGTPYNSAYQALAKGKGRFVIAGTWITADILKAMGNKVGFMLMPGNDPNSPVSLGGESLPFAITSGSKHPDVAAAYIDFLTDANAAKVLVATDNLPAIKGAPAPQGALNQEIAQAWQKLNAADGVIPYLDYTTPTFYDDITAAIQELLAGKQTPSQFTSSVQKKYAAWAESR